MKDSQNFQIFNGDCLEILKQMKSQSIDSMVTDPPAGISLLNLKWDDDKGGRDEWIKWLTEIMSECNRVLKPGAHAFVWALPRTSHWTATALEDAGFKVRDIVTHVFGTGFPKNMAIDKAIDRARYTNTDDVYRVTAWIRGRRDKLGLTNADLDRVAAIRGGACHWTAKPPAGQPAIPTLERWQKLEIALGEAPDWMRALIKPAHEPGDSWDKRNVVGIYQNGGGGLCGKSFETVNKTVTQAAGEEAKKWVGWGTALKPASEHWILAQKPISEHNLAANVLKHRTGALNIDASRISTDEKIPRQINLDFRSGGYLSKNQDRNETLVYEPHSLGRFPANLVFTKSDGEGCPIEALNQATHYSKPVSRYFKTFVYCPKPNPKERGLSNTHPTVKPIDLMKYLCQMITPSEGTVFDPFMGSGTTGIAATSSGFHFFGIEQDRSYFSIAKKRLLKSCRSNQSECYDPVSA